MIFPADIDFSSGGLAGLYTVPAEISFVHQVVYLPGKQQILYLTLLYQYPSFAKSELLGYAFRGAYWKMF